MVDTSVFVSFLVHEPTSAAVEQWFEQVEIEAVALSSWTIVEFVSAIGTKVRAHSLSSATGKAAIREFTSLVSRSLRPIEPSAGDFARAASIMERFELGLRAGDALHLAIAHRVHAASIVTLDKVLARATERLGLPSHTPA
jgi:predicted nucleic acid-binding protein